MITEEKKSEIECFDEMTCYFYIDAIGGYIWRTNHDAGHGRYEITEDMKLAMHEMYEQQQYCVQQLTKFGVDPESVKDRIDGNYWKWFRYWDDWKHALSYEEWSDFDKKMSNNEDYSKYLPTNKWNENI